jgi:hypothetical protein
VVPSSDRLVATGNRYEPYRQLDPHDEAVEAVTEHFRELLAAGRAESTLRSYGMDLLQWFRFLWSDGGVAWDRAARIEARDFSRWTQVTGKRPQPHWRAPTDGGLSGQPRGQAFAPAAPGSWMATAGAVGQRRAYPDSAGGCPGSGPRQPGPASPGRAGQRPGCRT